MNDVHVGSVEIGIAHEGKYGFYCVDKETWNKIKVIRKHFYRALTKAHAWQRYYSKAKHNRKGIAPELSPVDLVFCEQLPTFEYVRTPWFPKKYLQTQKNHETYLNVDIRIVEIMEVARMNWATKEVAEKFSLTKVQLDSGHMCGMGYYVNMMYDKITQASR